MKPQTRALLKSAQKTLERLEKTDKMHFPCNTISDYYEILRQLLEAKACEEGKKFRGEGAHRELIDYVCNTQKDRVFLQQLREIRNRIHYEGFTVSAEFIQKNEEKIIALIHKISL